MMNELKHKWRKFKCRITGGCEYAHGDTMVHEVPEKGVTCFTYRCIKCGAYKTYVLDTSALHSTYDIKRFNDF